MKRTCIAITTVVSILCCSCHQNPKESGLAATNFFGDSVLTIISSEKVNGYETKIFNSLDLKVINFRRGDSINQYIAIDRLPNRLAQLTCDNDGSIMCDLSECFPLQNKLEGECFFMDVNFDGEEDFVVSYPGYNRTYYACFDLVNGNQHNPCPGLLSPMDEAPYDNLAGGMNGETDFDYQHKTIHILEQIGVASQIETWCKLIPDKNGEEDMVRVIRREETEYCTAENGDQIKHTDVYELKGDTLKLVETIEEPI